MPEPATYRITLPNGKQSKPYPRSKIIAAFKAGKIPEASTVLVNGAAVNVRRFCTPKPPPPAALEDLPTDRTVISGSRSRWINSRLILAVCVAATAMIAGATWLSGPADVDPAVSELPTEPPNESEAERPSVMPEEEPPVTKDVLSNEANAISPSDAKERAEAVSSILTLLNFSLEANSIPLRFALRGFNERGDVGVLTIADSTLEIWFLDDNTVFMGRAFTDSASMLASDSDRRSKAIEGHLRAARSCCFVVSGRVRRSSQILTASNEWLAAKQFDIVLLGTSSRMFGPNIYAVYEGAEIEGKQYRTVSFEFAPSDEQRAIAAKLSAEDRAEAEEEAANAKTWAEVQNAVRGIEGYDMQPPINETTAGGIAVGDSMLAIARKLSSFGNETFVASSLSKVEWTDGDRKLIIDFEDGSVTGKMLL